MSPRISQIWPLLIHHPQSDHQHVCLNRQRNPDYRECSAPASSPNARPVQVWLLLYAGCCAVSGVVRFVCGIIQVKSSTHNAQYNGSTTPSRSDSIKDPAPETACGTQQQRSRSSVSASAHGQVQHDQMRPTAASLPRGLGMPSPALPRASTRSSAFVSGPNGFGVIGSGNRLAQSAQNRRANSPLACRSSHHH